MAQPIPDPLGYAAQRAGVPRRLLEELVGAESGGRDDAVSPKGARGRTQLMPGTARALERRYGIDTRTPLGNLLGGAYYLREQLDRFKTVPLALAAYNAGPGAVAKYGGIPPYAETRAYVDRITRNLSGSASPTNVGMSAPEPNVQTPNLGGGRREFASALLANLSGGGGKLDPGALTQALVARRGAQQAPAAESPQLPGQPPTTPERGQSGGGTLDRLLTQFGLADAVTSGDRPGAVTARGGASDHGRPGKARDISLRDPDFPRLVAYARANPGAFKDFIYSGLPWFVDEGRLYPIGQLNKTDRDNHGDHAHVSYR